MTQTTVRARLMASSMISGAALAAVSAGSALAQAAPAPAAAPAQTAQNGTAVQEFVVTGSRIPRPNLTSVSPITTVNSQDIKLQGTTNVEDLINNLPQAFADFGQFESNGSTGTATVDLRGLGNTRTLVLIDGKRVQPGDPTVPVADLNFIPPSLIERVEVLTGGASAVYGSDAVAGVVNFIMKHNFEGIQIDAETSIGEHGNSNQQVRAANNFGHNSFGFPSIDFPNGSVWTGNRNTVTITGGANSPDDKGNVEFYMSYTSIQPVLESKYDWSTCGLSTNNTNTLQQYCGGSSTDATGRLIFNRRTSNISPFKGANFNVTGTPISGVLPPFADSQLYNFAPLNYIQRPDTRYTAGEFSHYEINPMFDIYSSFMFMDDQTVAQIAPSGSFYGDNNYTIPCDDPLLSAAQANTLCGALAGTPVDSSALIGRRNVEGTGRVSDIEHEDYRLVLGSKGDLGSGWNYDFSGQYGKSMLTDVEEGYFLNSKLLNALDVVPVLNGVRVPLGTPGAVATCVSALAGGPDGQCVPYNLWSAGGVTPAQTAYLSGTGINTGYTTEQVVTGSVAGDLGQYGFKSPYAAEGVGISLGAEYRREYLQTSFDAAIQGGDLAGSGGSIPDTNGSQTDKDIFGELRVPLLQHMTGAEDVTLEAGYRYSNYTSGGGNSTYKVGLDWQIVPDLRLRGSYERAVRAPNVQELFLPVAPGLVVGTDPCGGSNPSFTAAQCANTFQTNFPNLTVAQILSGHHVRGQPCRPDQPYPGSGAGLWKHHPVHLRSVRRAFGRQSGTEAGDRQDLVGRLRLHADLHARVLPDGGLLQHRRGQRHRRGAAQPDLRSVRRAGNAGYCDLISRYNVNNYGIFGGLGQGSVFTQTQNVGSLKTSGIDFQADYRVALSDWHMPDYGSLDFNFQGTWVDNLTTNILTETYNCAGLYGTTCGTPTPKWRHQFRISWNTPWNLTLSANWRFISGTSLDFNTNQTPLQNGFTDILPTDAHIPDFSYFDLAFTYKLKDRYTFRGGVNNIFDRTPPLLDTNSFGISGPPFGNANTYPQVFDPLGRVFFLGLTADF